jgi:hypothetical protein
VAGQFAQGSFVNQYRRPKYVEHTETGDQSHN